MPLRPAVDPRLGQRIRQLRVDRGMSLRTLAVRIRSNSSSLSEYENAQTLPSAETIQLLDETLEAAGELEQMLASVAATPDRECTIIDRMELRRRDLHDAVSTGATSPAGLDDWERTVFRHGVATRTNPAQEMLAELEADFIDLRRALASRNASTASRRLTRVTAQMAGLTFLTLVKLGMPLAARAWARTARVAADESGDSALCSWVWAQEAYVYFYAHDLAQAIDVAVQAQALAGTTACVGTPLAAALEARANGALGNRRQAIAAMDRAQAGIARLEPDDLLPSAFGYNEAQFRFHEGNMYTHLRDTVSAWRAQQAALRLYPTSDFLDRALVGLDRAQCLADDGDARGALKEAIGAVVHLMPEQREGLIAIRGEAVLGSLPAPQRALPASQDLHHLLVPDKERTTL